MACGSLHTIVLTTEGKVYTWGCNDDSALGTSPSNPKEPSLVELDHPIDMIGAGDSFSIACNSKIGLIYFWGCLRTEVRGIKSILSNLRIILWSNQNSLTCWVIRI